MLETIIAPRDMKEALWELYVEYAHELSEYDHEKRDRGVRHFPGFDAYWQEENRFPFLILYDHEPIGFCLLQDTGICYRIDEFYVHPLHRRRGFGLQAVECIKDYCRNLGRHDVLAADVYVNNDPAVRFWMSAGFKDTGRRQRLKNVRLMETEADLKEQVAV